MKNKVFRLIGIASLTVLLNLCKVTDLAKFNQTLDDNKDQKQEATTMNKTNEEDILVIISKGLWHCVEKGGKERRSFSNDFLEAVERTDLIGKPSRPYFMTIDGLKSTGRLKIYGEPKYYDLIITKISDNEIQIQYPSGIKRKAKVIRKKTIEGEWSNPELFFEYSSNDPNGDKSLVQLSTGYSSIEDAEQFKTDSDNSPYDSENGNFIKE
jgi:hypothetical protein